MTDASSSQKKVNLLANFKDELAKYTREKEFGLASNWELLDERVRNYWRERSLPLLKFLADQDVIIKTPGGTMALKDIMEVRGHEGTDATTRVGKPRKAGSRKTAAKTG